MQSRRTTERSNDGRLPLYGGDQLRTRLARAEGEIAMGAIVAPVAIWITESREYIVGEVGATGILKHAGRAGRETVHSVLRSSFATAGSSFERYMGEVEEMMASGQVAAGVEASNLWTYAHPVYAIPMHLLSEVGGRRDRTLESIAWLILKEGMPKGAIRRVLNG